MKTISRWLQLIAVCLFCSGLGLAYERISFSVDEPIPEKTVAASSGRSSAPRANEAKTELKENEERLREMDRSILEVQETIRRLATEVERLRAERNKSAAESPEPLAAASLTPSTKPASMQPPGDVITNPETRATEGEGRHTLVESILPDVKLSGTVMLFAYSPLRVPGARSFFDLYSAGLNLDREGDKLGFHVEFRYRSTKFRSFFDGTNWVQEAYLKAKAPGGTLKVGRIYKQLGIFSDFSFFGDIPYFDGLKYNPEWGASYEGDNKITDRISFQHYAQFFRSDGRTNGSFPGRDVVSDKGSQRRNAVVLRGIPKFKLSDQVSLAVGSTFERGQVARPREIDNNTYRRVGGESTLTIGPATLFGEVMQQTFEGPRFADLPKVTYTAVGGNYDLKKFSLHFNYSQGNYNWPGRRKEYIVQPGLVIPLGKGFSLYNEFNYWIIDGGKKSIFDRSLSTVLIFNY